MSRTHISRSQRESIFDIVFMVRDPGNTQDRDETRLSQRLLLEESPSCRMVKGVYDCNFIEVQKATEDGGRVSDREFNALDYTLKLYKKNGQKPEFLKICEFFISRFPEIITETNAKTGFSTKNDVLANLLIRSLKSENNPIGLKIFQDLCTTAWKFPVAEFLSMSGHGSSSRIIKLHHRQKTAMKDY